MNIKVFAILIISLFIIRCTGNDVEIHLIKNVFLFHNGDNIHQGYIIVKKVDQNFYNDVIDENVTDIYCNPTNIYIRSNPFSKKSFFYEIRMSVDSSKSPIVMNLKEHRYLELISNCLSCKVFKIKKDIVTDRWYVDSTQIFHR